MTSGKLISVATRSETAALETLFRTQIINFIENEDAPCWHTSLNLFDSLARIVGIIEKSSDPRYENLLLKFLVMELSVPEVQNSMESLLSHCAYLRQYFAGFLDAPVKTRVQQDAARLYLCTITGLPANLSRKSVVRQL